MGSEFFSLFTTIQSFGAPVAIAGDDLEVNKADDVIIDGSNSSEQNGLPLTYNWSQIGGPSIGAIPSTPTLSFSTQDTVNSYCFELVVLSDAGISLPDTVMVFVCEEVNNCIWVSPTGNNGNTGTRELPKQTIQAAIDSISTCCKGSFYRIHIPTRCQ